MLDHVSRPEVFAALHAPLAQGYALDALEAATVHANAATAIGESAAEFLQRILDARITEHDGIGIGRDVRFAQGGVAGAGLVAGVELVQLTAFPDSEQDVPEADIPRARIRRPSRRPPPDMWLLTPRGFYSVVANRDDPETVLVRARAREDLEGLSDLIGSLEILETPDRDYRWRAIVSRRAWSGALVLLAAEIDYPNFKAEVERRQGRERADVYHAVWARLLRLQAG